MGRNVRPPRAGQALAWLVLALLAAAGAVAPGLATGAGLPGGAPTPPVLAPSLAEQLEIGGGIKRADRSPRLDSRLAALVHDRDERGAAAIADARAAGIEVVDSRVRVIVETAVGAGDAVRATITAAGGDVEAEYGRAIQARLPIGSLETIAGQPGAARVRAPYQKRLLSVAGEGSPAINASAWHAAGLTGAGVKVAVIDGGFAGYEARRASGDLPASLKTKDLCSGNLSSDIEHGAAVAEVVHQIAPDAQLYLICFDTEVELGLALEYARAEGVQIVVHSVGWLNTSRGDGLGGPGTPDAIVAAARASGILWVNAAGNDAQRHWSGTFSDPNGNGVHNWAPNDEGNTIVIAAGSAICAALKWDDWPVTSQDYDLGLVQSSTGRVVAASADFQTGAEPPTEGFCYLNTTGITQQFFIAILKFRATATPRFDLFVEGADLEYSTAAGSIVEPASSPNAMAVGAACWQSWRTADLEPYSARGPTIDGRVKPDIVGPDSVSSATFGGAGRCVASGFAGTSASAPHVGGAAALFKQMRPASTAANLQALLEERAIDAGPPGKDSSYGAGKLWLGEPDHGGTTVTVTATPTVTVTPTITPTGSITPPRSITPTGRRLFLAAAYRDAIPTPTPTSSPTPTPIPARPAYRDDFENTASGWPAFDQAEYGCGYAAGEYRIVIRSANFGALCGPGRSAADLEMEVDARATGQTSGSQGLFFAASDAGWYEFVLGNGRFGLRRIDVGSGTIVTLIGPTSSAAIHPGTERNRLRVVRSGTSIALSVNGQSVGQATDSALGAGEVGLVAVTSAPNFEARFDNFLLASPGGLAASESLSSAGTPSDAGGHVRLRSAVPGAPLP